VNEQHIRRNAALMSDQKFTDRQLRSARWWALELPQRTSALEMGLAAQ
jgi:hypothetical protein